MEDYTVCVTDDSYFSYPDEKEIISIKQSLMSSPMKVTLDSLINSLDKSSKVVLLSHNKKEGHRVVFDYQDVVMLEITNTNHNYQKFTLEDAKKNQFLQENAYFVAENKVSKRITTLVIAFKLSRGLTDKKEVESVYSQLFNLNSIFNSQLNLDKIRSNSVFLVNTNTAYVYSEDNLLVPDNIIKDFKLMLEKNDTKKVFLGEKKDIEEKKLSCLSDKLNIPKKDLNVKTLFTQHKFEELKGIFRSLGYDYKGIKYSNLTSLTDFICENISLSELLGTTLNTKFNSIFNTSTIEKTDFIVMSKDKTEIYIAGSETNLFKGNIVAVISRLTQLSKFKTIKIIAEIINIEIEVDEDTKDSIAKINNLLDSLYTGNLGNKYPYLFQVLKGKKDQIKSIFKSIFETPLYNWDTNTWTLISTKSTSTLSLEMSDYLGESIKSKMTLSRTLNFMVVLGLINKLEDEELPTWLKSNLEKYKNSKGYKQRTEVLSIRIINKELLEQSNLIAETLIDLKFKVGLISYDYLLLNLGKETADKVYLQKTEEERQLSNKLNKIRKFSAKYFSYQLDNYGYVEESKMINIVTKNIKRNKNTQELTKLSIKDEFKKLGNSFYDSDGVLLKRVFLTKSLREKLNIQDIEESKRPMVYIR